MSRLIIGMVVLCVVSFSAFGQVEQEKAMPGWDFFEGSWRYQADESFDYVFTIVSVSNYTSCDKLTVSWTLTDLHLRIGSIDYGGTATLLLFADESGQAASGIAQWNGSGGAEIRGYGIFRRAGLENEINLTLYVYPVGKSESCLSTDNTQRTIKLIRDVAEGTSSGSQDVSN